MRISHSGAIIVDDDDPHHPAAHGPLQHYSLSGAVVVPDTAIQATKKACDAMYSEAETEIKQLIAEAKAEREAGRAEKARLISEGYAERQRLIDEGAKIKTFAEGKLG